MRDKFKAYKQLDEMDCGPTCLRMIAKHYGVDYSLPYLRSVSNITREGVSFSGLSDAAEKIGLRTLSVKVALDKLVEEAVLPCILYWDQRHFVILYKVKNNEFYIADPSQGKLKLSREDFVKHWTHKAKNEEEAGICLLLEPSPAFYEKEGVSQEEAGFKFLFKYLFSYKKLIIQLLLGFLIGSAVQLLLPFLTQSLVDFGINYQDVDFVYLILGAQLMLFFSKATVDLIRSWILLFIGARINISLVSDFLIKLMKMPIAYFDSKLTGDIVQRINDHYRIESFLTSATLNLLFSFINLIVFGAVLCYYNITIFALFFVGSAVYIGWIALFMGKRKSIDFKRFVEGKEQHNNLIELISGMQEIKLHNSERPKRWEWERIQVRIYKINIESLKLAQYQQAGGVFVHEVKNIIISVIAAKAVIDGEMTLGMMLAVQYIIGQLNSPIEQMIGFMQSAQDAKLSLERLAEIHMQEDEAKDEAQSIKDYDSDGDIQLRNVSFKYDKTQKSEVLKNINLSIPRNKVTAIVGTSGSGKTTLIKMLLKFYNPDEGQITIGGLDLARVDNSKWRADTGAVLQDGYIFTDTIKGNIAVNSEYFIDEDRLNDAGRISNIQPFVESLPLGMNTTIGKDGNGLSTGQKQRILIARAIYKNPKILMFDEATNALDANNEKEIVENLNNFFDGKTVVVVAHRLSTVKNADQIVVLDKGEVVEVGTHAELVKAKGAYFKLVKNQLELGD